MRAITIFFVLAMLLNLGSCKKGDWSTITVYDLQLGDDEEAEETSNNEEEKPLGELVIPPLMAVSKTTLGYSGDELALVFNDSNKYQYAFAERIGIRPLESIKDAYYTTRPVVSIKSCDDYRVDFLTHSVPYLVPEASELLSTLGRNFKDSLESKKMPGRKIIVTSLLRTAASVKELKKVNINATDSSTHKFATTFDISYLRFDGDESGNPQLKKVLSEVIYDLRAQKRCLVKYEKQSSCFHITVCKDGIEK